MNITLKAEQGTGSKRDCTVKLFILLHFFTASCLVLFFFPPKVNIEYLLDFFIHYYLYVKVKFYTISQFIDIIIIIKSSSPLYLVPEHFINKNIIKNVSFFTSN